MRRLLLAALLLAGCARPMIWDKPGGTQEQFARDKYDCLREATYVVPPTAYTPPMVSSSGGFFGGMASGAAQGIAMGQAQGGAAVNNELFRACMEAQGWTLKRK